MTIELTPLQRAYLLGRKTLMPLGGVAMQEFREYRGRFEIADLQRRLQSLAEKHASLRTVIDTENYTKSVRDRAQVNLDVIDLSGFSRAEAEQKIENGREDYAHQLADLSEPPWSVAVYKLPQVPEDGDTCVTFVRFDALILDGRSIAALLVELFDTSGEESGAQGLLEAPAGPDQASRSADAAYWKTKLSSYAGPPQLPWKQALPSIRTSRYQRQSVTIERQRLVKLTRLGARLGLFQNTVLTAVVLGVLSHWQNGEMLSVGIPAAPAAGEILQNGSTFIAVNWASTGTDGLSEKAQKLQSDILEGLEHLAFSGVDINRVLLEAASPDSGVALPVVVTNGLSWPGLSGDSPMRLQGGLTQTPQVAMDIRLSANAARDLVIDIDYAVEALDHTVIADILVALGKAVETICTTETLQFGARDILDFRHYRHNTPEDAYQSGGYLAKIARHLYDAPPANDALVYGTCRVSYPDLGKGVGKAMRFLESRGIGRGAVVALALPRSPEQTMLTLACAFRGIVWVPIDAGAPPDRLKFLHDNCRPDLAIGLAPVAGHDVVPLETVFDTDVPDVPQALMQTLDDLSSSPEAAYYLYTSGTTGKPKGVVLSNRSTDNVITSTNADWNISERDVFISVSPLHHDMSVYEIFGCLTAGATLVQPEQGEEKDAVRWCQLVAAHGVTIWSSVPTILEMLLSCQQKHELDSLRLINQGGDYVKPAIIAELRQTNPAARLGSIGGPTETTIWSIWHRITAKDTGAIPYGRPLPANSYFVLDDNGEHCPVGVVGRIYSSGVNTALGYLEDGALTQHDFIEILDEKGTPLRAFRSGDRGRYREDGLILFDSRVAGYVKVRGVRVSIPDVENVMVQHPDVSRLQITCLGDEKSGQSELGVLFVPRSGTGLSAAELRNFARQRLPESHVPSRFLEVVTIPLSANGKPDRRKARSLFAGETAKAGPRQQTGAGAALKIILDVLQPAQVTLADEATDLLSLGLLPSHLKLISARIRAELGVDLLPKQLLACRNAHEVDQLISKDAA
ncbi:AMP-binding protein [Roseibium sp. RKSG952]|uniref:AMP-binding protein n=1 Tax=Roseibium sp. RKSG952 TaxID=2529384 RepID=UPI0012BCEB6D|nr:AMP-binding protein [Roseibium sp. RKSG952]MTH96588.1 peptide synthetase [Roseibium sp. RKSG952]